jgi:hypothetical protein
MKDIQKKDKNDSAEFLADTLKDSKKSAKKSAEMALAAVLIQGEIPRTDSRKLMPALSLLGNYSFLQAVERKENQDYALQKYVDAQTFNRTEMGLLKARFAGSFPQEVNELEQIPEINARHPIPNLVGEQNANLSALAPVSFEQVMNQTVSADSSDH